MAGDVTREADAVGAEWDHRAQACENVGEMENLHPPASRLGASALTRGLSPFASTCSSPEDIVVRRPSSVDPVLLLWWSGIAGGNKGRRYASY